MSHLAKRAGVLGIGAFTLFGTAGCVESPVIYNIPRYGYAPVALPYPQQPNISPSQEYYYPQQGYYSYYPEVGYSSDCVRVVCIGNRGFKYDHDYYSHGHGGYGYRQAGRPSGYNAPRGQSGGGPSVHHH